MWGGKVNFLPSPFFCEEKERARCLCVYINMKEKVRDSLYMYNSYIEENMIKIRNLKFQISIFNFYDLYKR